MPRFSYLIFDLDGTLDNSMPYYTKGFVQVGIECGLLEEGLAAEYKNSAGLPLRQQFLQVFSRASVEANLDRCVARFWEIVGACPAQPFPDVQNVILSLSKQQRHLYLTTGSKTENALRKMNEMRISPYFNLIFGSEELLEKGPLHLQRFEEHSQDPYFKQKALYLGDGTADMRFARDFKITAVGIATTITPEKLIEVGAHYVIGSLKELLPLLDDIEGGELSQP